MVNMAPKPRKPKTAFASRLIAERKRRQPPLTQTDAARLCGLSLRSWMRYEAGIAPSPPIRKLLEQFLQHKI